jgi:integrase
MASFVKRTKHGKTVYLARIRNRNGAVAKTFTRLTDAKRWANETELKLETGEYQVEEAQRKVEQAKQEAQANTFADLIKRYLASPAYSALKSADVRNTRKAHLAWWFQQLGNMPVRGITPALVAGGRDVLRQAGKAEATCNRYLAALSKVMVFATRELGWIDVNPVGRVSKFKEDNARDRVLGDEEFDRLLAACSNQDIKDVIILARYTAARRGEICGLRREDVDLERRTVSFINTKNGDSRSVALSAPALAVLQRRIKVPRLDTPLLFPQRRNPQRPAEYRGAFEAARKRAGLQDFDFHGLRHTALTELAKSGATLSELRAIAGHKSMEMVARYQHLCEDSTRSILERMADGSRHG